MNILKKKFNYIKIAITTLLTIFLGKKKDFRIKYYIH
jgi:hypothetical protein